MAGFLFSPEGLQEVLEGCS